MRFSVRILTIVLVSLSGLSLHAFDFDYKERDKQMHMGVTALISGSTYLAFRSNNVSRLTSGVSAMLITMGFSFLKERFIDETYNVEDMQANFVGASAGVIIPVVFTF